MSAHKLIQIGLMIGLALVALFLFRGPAIFLIPLFILGYLLLSRLNRKGWNAGEEDPADWWKKGKKQNWDI